MPNVSNESIFNAVRERMAASFQERIPAATKENLAEISSMLTSEEYQPEFNQFQSALINRIGMVLFRDYTLNNPLAKYIYGEMAYGDAIEEIATDIVQGRAMDYGTCGEALDPFVKVCPEVKAEYHKINEPIQYATSFEKDRLKRAFTAPNGLQRLLNMFVGKLYSSANLDTWLLTKSAMAYYINDNKSADMPLLDTQKITVSDVTDEASAKTFLLQIKNAVSAMKFPNNAFNPQQIHKTLDNKDLVLFIRADVMNTIGVEALAAAFNEQHLNLHLDIEPMDDFGTDVNGGDTDDVIAVLAEKDWLLITQQFEDLENIYNPRGRYWTYFLTRGMSFGTTYFKDCVIFRKNWD